MKKIDKFTMTEVLNKKTGGKYFIFGVFIERPDDWGSYKNYMCFYHIEENRFVSSYVSDTSLKRNYKVLNYDINYKAIASIFNAVFTNKGSNFYVEKYIEMETSE